MRLNRFYHEGELHEGMSLSLSEEASHHLGRVLRARVGDELILFNGIAVGEFLGSISEISKRTVTVTIKTFSPRDVESPIHTHLAQVISRGDKMDLVLQKSVELGVNEITPLISERCGIKLSDDKTEKRESHWRAVIKSAAEQSGRTQLPKLHSLMSFKDFIAQSRNGVTLIGHPHHNSDWSQVRLGLHQTNEKFSATLCVGPEGGFSENEISYVNEHAITNKQLHLLKLGPRILRTETAGIVMLSVLQKEFGDF